MKTKIKYPYEDEEQENFINWFRFKYPTYKIFHVPNGGKRNPREAKRLKDIGVLKGVFDLQILPPYNNETIYIEMKRQNDHKVSKEQKEFYRLATVQASRRNIL